jgi:hypothetical protein
MIDDNRYGDVPNIEMLKIELTTILKKYRLINERGSVGEIIIGINNSAIANVRKDKWLIK